MSLCPGALWQPAALWDRELSHSTATAQGLLQNCLMEAGEAKCKQILMWKQLLSAGESISCRSSASPPIVIANALRAELWDEAQPLQQPI